MTSADRADAHVQSAVGRASFAALPFPHLFVPNLLPGDLYDGLQAAWPAFAEMAKPNPTIGRIDFTEPGFPSVQVGETSLSDAQCALWATFRGLMGGAFFDTAFDRFQPHLAGLGRELLAPSSGRPVADWLHGIFKRPDLSFWRGAKAGDFTARDQFLTTRMDLSILAPHIDPPHFHFTLIVYFAADADHQHLGTTLFRQVTRGRPRLPAEFHEWTYAQLAVQYDIACEPVVEIPFVPNAALLFLNGPRAWHGQHLTEPMERRTYNSFFTVQREHLPRAMRAADIAALEKHKLIF